MSHPHSYLSNQSIGIVGVSLYGVIFVVSVRMVYNHFIPYKAPWYSTRKIFHLLVMCYAGLQTYSYVSYAEGNEHFSKACYSCHLLGIFAEVVAFSLVAVLSKNNARNLIIPGLILIDLGFLVYIAFLIINMLLSHQSFTDWANGSIYESLLFVEPILLLVIGSCVLYLGTSVYKKLTNHPSWSALPAQDKQQVVYRLFYTMTFCFAGFSLRAVMELYLYFKDADGVSTDVSSD